ncbi:hypothetical protein F5146DRAFT_1000156 [Armillaria mellea]|nr:hypothetical protein F5146DRAFT_1000156 [Armillaria mellea]
MNIVLEERSKEPAEGTRKGIPLRAVLIKAHFKARTLARRIRGRHKKLRRSPFHRQHLGSRPPDSAYLDKDEEKCIMRTTQAISDHYHYAAPSTSPYFRLPPDNENIPIPSDLLRPPRVVEDSGVNETWVEVLNDALLKSMNEQCRHPPTHNPLLRLLECSNQHLPPFKFPDDVTAVLSLEDEARQEKVWTGKDFCHWKRLVYSGFMSFARGCFGRRTKNGTIESLPRSERDFVLPDYYGSREGERQEGARCIDCWNYRERATI